MYATSQENKIKQIFASSITYWKQIILKEIFQRELFDPSS